MASKIEAAEKAGAVFNERPSPKPQPEAEEGKPPAPPITDWFVKDRAGEEWNGPHETQEAAASAFLVSVKKAEKK